jgi:hypothetical protein
VFTDFSFSTRFKIPGGATEAVAGIVFRAQDQNNYYVLRASTEGNLLWYRVIGGKQYDMLGIGVRIAIPMDTWEDLRVDCSGSGIRCFLNGRLAIPPAKPGAPTNDLAINDTTFAGGKVGFWTRGASQCYFVDAHINYTQKTPLMQTVAEETKKKYGAIESLKIYAMKGGKLPVVVGDGDHSALGEVGTKVEADVLATGTMYYMKIHKAVEVTLPLRDRNGDIVAALKIRMKSFPGETEGTAVGKASVAKRHIEEQVDKMQGTAE